MVDDVLSSKLCETHTVFNDALEFNVVMACGSASLLSAGSVSVAVELFHVPVCNHELIQVKCKVTDITAVFVYCSAVLILSINSTLNYYDDLKSLALAIFRSLLLGFELAWSSF